MADLTNKEETQQPTGGLAQRRQ